MMHQQRVSRSG